MKRFAESGSHWGRHPGWRWGVPKVYKSDSSLDIRSVDFFTNSFKSFSRVIFTVRLLVNVNSFKSFIQDGLVAPKFMEQKELR